jgi:hypothetical protein
MVAGVGGSIAQRCDVHGPHSSTSATSEVVFRGSVHACTAHLGIAASAGLDTRSEDGFVVDRRVDRHPATSGTARRDAGSGRRPFRLATSTHPRLTQP